MTEDMMERCKWAERGEWRTYDRFLVVRVRLYTSPTDG